MKNVLALFLVLIILYGCTSNQDNSLRVMTYNIRYANNNPGEEWSLRKANVAEMIRYHNPDVFGVQEALHEQIEFLSENFDQFKYIGVGREDGKTKGEYSAIFVSQQYNIIDNGTFWLSDNPGSPSVGWDAAMERIATWAIIKNKQFNNSIFIVNTHFDHIGIEARFKSAELIMNKIEALSNNLPTILMGDFNFTSNSEAYKLIQNYGLLKDTRYTADYVYGTDISFNGFKDSLESEDKIDFIFASSEIIVTQHAVIGDKIGGTYPSDHMPVIADVLIEN